MDNEDGLLGEKEIVHCTYRRKGVKLTVVMEWIGMIGCDGGSDDDIHVFCTMQIGED